MMGVDVPEWLLVPIFRLTYTTDLAPDEVCKRIRAVTGKGERSDRALLGRVEGDQFLVRRRFIGFNSFAPFFKGEVRASHGYTEVHLSVMMFQLTLLMLPVIIWFLLDALEGWFARAAVIAIACLVALGSFLGEYRKSARVLSSLLQAQEAGRDDP